MHPSIHGVSRELSRRDFVRLAAGAAGIAGVAAASAAPAHARAAQPGAPAKGVPAGDRPLKVGLIGCGGRGTGAAWQALNADTGVTLHAMADMFPDRLASCLKGLEAQAAELRTQDPAKNLSDRIAVPPERRFTGFDGYKRLLECGCDVVLLCAYPHFRPAHLEAAVAAGCHVFCEKPMAVDAPGLRRVRAAAEAARARGLTLVSGFCWRYADAERATYERIHAGAIGDLVTIHTTYHTSTLSPRPRRPDWSDMEFQLRNWWHFTWLSGDHIVEQACHSIDKICWAMRNAPPVRCVALGGRAARQGAESGHVFDHFAVVYEYEGGGRAFHTTRQIDHCPNDNSDYVYGTSGSAEINGWKPVHEIRDRSGKVTWRYDGQRRDMYQNEHDELFRSVRAGQARNDGDFMCTSTMMSIMGRMAAYTGQTIAWDQAWKSEEDLTPAAYAMGPLAVPPVAVPGVTKFR